MSSGSSVVTLQDVEIWHFSMRSDTEKSLDRSRLRPRWDHFNVRSLVSHDYLAARWVVTWQSTQNVRRRPLWVVFDPCCDQTPLIEQIDRYRNDSSLLARRERPFSGGGCLLSCYVTTGVLFEERVCRMARYPARRSAHSIEEFDASIDRRFRPFVAGNPHSYP